MMGAQIRFKKFDKRHHDDVTFLCPGLTLKRLYMVALADSLLKPQSK